MEKRVISCLINSFYDPLVEKQTFRFQNLTHPELSDIIESAKLHNLHWEYDIEKYSDNGYYWKITNFTVYGDDNDMDKFSELIYTIF